MRVELHQVRRRAAAALAVAVLAASVACSSSGTTTDAPLKTSPTTPTPGKDAGAGDPVTDPDAGEPEPSTDAGTQDSAPLCATTAPSNRCGLSPQCGCESNETCDITNPSTGAVSCVSAGTKTLGHPCNTTGDCLSGLTCEYGVCRPYCSKVGKMCTITGTGTCVAYEDDSGNAVPNDLICTVSCDPVAPTALCGAGNTCLWFPTLYAPAKVTDCNFAGSTAAQAACSTDFDCIAGYACDPNKGVCEKWCRMGTSYTGDCPTKFTCTDVYGTDAPVISGIKEGLCEN